MGLQSVKTLRDAQIGTSSFSPLFFSFALIIFISFCVDEEADRRFMLLSDRTNSILTVDARLEPCRSDLEPADDANGVNERSEWGRCNDDHGAAGQRRDALEASHLRPTGARHHQPIAQHQDAAREWRHRQHVRFLLRFKKQKHCCIQNSSCFWLGHCIANGRRYPMYPPSTLSSRQRRTLSALPPYA